MLWCLMLWWGGPKNLRAEYQYSASFPGKRAKNNFPPFFPEKGRKVDFPPGRRAEGGFYPRPLNCRTPKFNFPYLSFWFHFCMKDSCSFKQLQLQLSFMQNIAAVEKETFDPNLSVGHGLLLLWEPGAHHRIGVCTSNTPIVWCTRFRCVGHVLWETGTPGNCAMGFH